MIVATGYAGIILFLTVLCGAPFVYHLNKNNNIITKLTLSFVIGYTLLSLTGLLANIVGTNPFFAQLLILLIALSAVSFFVLARNRFSGIKFKSSDIKTIWIRGRLETEDKLVLVFGLIYMLGCLYFFDSIIMWMGGDAQGHASIIRYLLDGASVPVSVYPFGAKWDYYPKAFHLYAYFWASLLPIGMVRLIQVVPVIVTTVTSLLVYSMVRESGKREIALYAFVIACFCFIQHSAFLIWAGYPAGAAEMLLVGIVLAILVDRRFLPLLLIGIAFTHTRFLVYCAAIVFVWIVVESIFRLYRGEWKTNSGNNKTKTKTKKHLAFYSVVTVAAIGIAIIVFFILIKTGILHCNAVHTPIFLTELATNRELTVEYIARWYPAVLSVVGMVVAAFKRDKLDRIVFAWFGGIIAVVILVDTGLLDLPISVDRAFTKLYVPLSILAAYPIYAVQRYLTVTDFANSNKNKNNSRGKDKGRDKDRKQTKVVLALAIMLLLIGGVSTGVVFKSYVDPWAIPEADYRAMVWMNEQRFDNAICINLDTVGRWVYPVTGIQVSNPRSVPRPPHVTREGQVIGHPNEPTTLDRLYNDSMRYEHVLLYVSNVTNTRPGHKPPFLRYGENYPNVNVSNFNATFYDLIYASDNAYVFEYKPFFQKESFTKETILQG